MILLLQNEINIFEINVEIENVSKIIWGPDTIRTKYLMSMYANVWWIKVKRHPETLVNIFAGGWYSST